MIIKRIPDKFNIDELDIAEFIYQSVGKRFPITFSPNSRILKIDEDLTTKELTKIKTDFLAAVGEVDDL